jgi:hypothetical protein
MGSRGPEAPTPAQILEAPRSLSMAVLPDASSKDPTTRERLEDGTPPRAALGASAACETDLHQKRRAQEGRVAVVIRAIQARRRLLVTAEEEPPRRTTACPPAPPGRGLHAPGRGRAAAAASTPGFARRLPPAVATGGMRGRWGLGRLKSHVEEGGGRPGARRGHNLHWISLPFAVWAGCLMSPPSKHEQMIGNMDKTHINLG